MRIGSLLLVIWLAIGAIAAAQRDYFKHNNASCAKAGTVALTEGGVAEVGSVAHRVGVPAEDVPVELHRGAVVPGVQLEPRRGPRVAIGSAASSACRTWDGA